MCGMRPVFHVPSSSIQPWELLGPFSLASHIETRLEFQHQEPPAIAACINPKRGRIISLDHLPTQNASNIHIVFFDILSFAISAHSFSCTCISAPSSAAHNSLQRPRSCRSGSRPKSSCRECQSTRHQGRAAEDQRPTSRAGGEVDTQRIYNQIIRSRKLARLAQREKMGPLPT